MIIQIIIQITIQMIIQIIIHMNIQIIIQNNEDNSWVWNTLRARKIYPSEQLSLFARLACEET